MIYKYPITCITGRCTLHIHYQKAFLFKVQHTMQFQISLSDSQRFRAIDRVLLCSVVSIKYNLSSVLEGLLFCSNLQTYITYIIYVAVHNTHITISLLQILGSFLSHDNLKVPRKRVCVHAYVCVHVCVS